MAIKWRSEFVSAFNIFRCLILLSLLLFNSSCSFGSIERKGDRGDCSDITDGVSDKEFRSLKLEDERNVDELKAALKSWDGTTRYKALWLLISKAKPHTILTALMTMVQDEDPRVRETSIEGLAMAATSQETLISQILPILTQSMQDKDPGVRVASAGGLTQITRHQKTLIPQVFPLLKNGLKDRSACVRARYAGFLESLISESKAYTNEVKLVIPDLIVVATRDSSAWARSHALFALGAANVASEEIVPVLVRVLKHDPDARRRSVAVAALSNHATPESTKALIEAISDPDERVRTQAVYNVVRIEPSSLINQSNLKKLSDQGLKTAIWMLESPTEEPGWVGAKNYIPSILKALIAERNSRLQK
ncbi:HEAT repeat domain-containing protein [Microcoleus vaginatus GB1-A2]|uniref:HEAT repeat domain-containing protein n=1 Tax=Microcoleus vaginatus TaxID=119532 RepID=UPI001688BD5F|nr:HEAT repeat domain-containing protein [Microcoleus sp. FACHB-61]